MTTTRKTVVGFFMAEFSEEDGHIIVTTNGAPLRRKIGYIDEIVDSFNQFEGLYRRTGTEIFVITVAPAFRDEANMKLLFVDFIESFKRILKKDIIADICKDVVHVSPAETIDALMKR